MGKITDIPVPLDFTSIPPETSRTHIIEWNPAEETRTQQRQEGRLLKPSQKEVVCDGQ